jgi:hypothetical protein
MTSRHEKSGFGPRGLGLKTLAGTTSGSRLPRWSTTEDLAEEGAQDFAIAGACRFEEEQRLCLERELERAARMALVGSEWPRACGAPAIFPRASR